MTAAPRRSLFKRTLAVFFGMALAAWCALMVSEVYDVKVVQARNGQAWNHVWAEHVLLQLQAWGDDPVRLQAGLQALENLRAQEWHEMGYAPPTIQLQVLRDGQLLHQFASPDIGRRKAPNPAQHASDGDWLYVELALPEQRLQVRRWQEVPGDWHFGLRGLAYYSRPFFLSLPVLMLTAWLILRLGFAPLRRVGQQIGGRSPNHLTALPPSPYVELAPVVDAVNGLLAQLREHRERERDFLLNAAHGLKTPLAVIQANADTLQGGGDATRAAAARQRLADGVRQAGHMVHQVLSLARSEADPLTLERREVDIVGLLRDRIVLAADLAQRRGIDIELIAPAEALLTMHRETMGSLIDNLLDNAVKYSPPGGRVVVELRCEDDDGDACCLSVADTGPGIEPALRHKVFERFYRLPDQDVPGSGLGLTIVERAAAQHAAQVRLDEGCDGRGLRVEVRLPRRP